MIWGIAERFHLHANAASSLGEGKELLSTSNEQKKKKAAELFHGNSASNLLQ